MQKSGEDYLEAILQLSGGDDVGVRVTDVARKLGVSKPSVNRAMDNLAAEGYVNKETYGDIFLTDEGRSRAKEVYRRHRELTRFFAEVLGVAAEQAEKDACLIEHDISSESMQKLIQFMEKYSN